MALKQLLDIIVTDNIRIKPKTTLSPTQTEDGRLDIKDGILYIYDATRVKWLSVQRQTLVFGRNGTTNNQYLNFAGGGISSKSGYKMIRNAVITGWSVQTSTTKNYSIRLRRNDTATNLMTLNVAGYGAINGNTNREINVNDYLQCYLEFTGTGFGVDDPIVCIEFAWRV